MRVEEYITADGRNPFADWFDRLDPQAAAKVNTYLTRLAMGNTSRLKPVKGALKEVRIDWGPGYRIYAGQDGKALIILLGGGTKKRQRQDLDTAAALWEEYKNRKKEERDGDHTQI
ncbi:MAG: type II toxin-antitoxin system RelE/ParE family toxin [Candidatus Omnitrophica bacterium]|nr:type II toxin-antitoxin system RelE/ParE family toxin [Candidatus Omnitrophota bacterium]